MTLTRKGASAFSGKVGEKVASELCTVVDDGTIAYRRGSLNVDDRRHASSGYNVLIENGTLKGYMQDKMNFRLISVGIIQRVTHAVNHTRISR